MKYWEIYRYRDVHQGWGHAGTHSYIKAPDLQSAEELMPDRIGLGIREISENELREISRNHLTTHQEIRRLLRRRKESSSK